MVTAKKQKVLSAKRGKASAKSGGGLFAALGAAAGLGNAFRFPALCARYGTGFLLTYALSLVLVCYPLLCAELSFGCSAYCGRGGRAWAAIMRAATANSALIALYYGHIAAKLCKAGLDFAVNGGVKTTPYLSAVGLIVVFFSALLLLKKGCLGVSGRLSIGLSLTLFCYLAIRGIACGGLPKFDFSAFCCGAAWTDALGQSLLSLSLAAGVMPTFARSMPKNFSPKRTAAVIIAANFIGCIAAAFATLPFVSDYPAHGGINCAFTIFPQVIYSTCKSLLGRRIFGAAAYLTLGVVAVHSLCSLAAPLVIKAVKKTRFSPFLFCLAFAVLSPLFGLNGGEILSACDRVSCSVIALAVAFAESLFFALLRHSMGAIRSAVGKITQFLCPVACGFLLINSLCFARVGGFSFAASAFSFAYLFLVILYFA